MPTVYFTDTILKRYPTFGALSAEQRAEVSTFAEARAREGMITGALVAGGAALAVVLLLRSRS